MRLIISKKITSKNASVNKERAPFLKHEAKFASSSCMPAPPATFLLQRMNNKQMLLKKNTHTHIHTHISYNGNERLWNTKHPRSEDGVIKYCWVRELSQGGPESARTILRSTFFSHINA